MMRELFRAKIHRATVTDANVSYEGSVTIDQELLEAADILEYEAVHVWNVTRGSRLMTYAIQGERGSGVVCINGAAAHLNQPGDIVILAAFAHMSQDELRSHRPRVVWVDERNRIVGDRLEVPGPAGQRREEARSPGLGVPRDVQCR